ncbi:DUF503 domain-containing protein [Desulfohalovibrio reitneri]|jgi:hypothetical protein|uniref:DUF503 domain-containing protein n=1 Tax=Desulfohalovibrio reitneri TaxID=1307759 RepID=UPI0004A6FE74|nr:DUF503 domain-containing protein [Desulfohalovibrio reitneri]
MYFGVLRLEFTLHGNRSLKGKRKVANSIKMKLRSKFNVSVAEVGPLDDPGRLDLAAVSVAGDYNVLEGRMQKALNMVEAAADEELTDSSVDIFSED